ncbi:hypothetical protein Bca4012_082535 [Brassica carinata]
MSWALFACVRDCILYGPNKKRGDIVPKQKNQRLPNPKRSLSSSCVPRSTVTFALLLMTETVRFMASPLLTLIHSPQRCVFQLSRLIGSERMCGFNINSLSAKHEGRLLQFIYNASKEEGE